MLEHHSGGADSARLRNMKTLSCGQVYQIWLAEPELIRILDLRAPDEYRKIHVPGSRWVALEDLDSEIEALGQRLGVLILPEGLKHKIVLKEYENCVFMDSCSKWNVELKPVTGRDSDFYIRLKRMSPSRKENMQQKNLIFHQLFEPETSTYTYLIADAQTKEAAIIDPVLETVDRDLKLVDELGLKLLYVLDTHIHADHVTGAGEIRKRTGAKTAVSMDAGAACVDIALEDGQQLLLGDQKLEVIATPGHTNTCMTFAFSGMIFTGDSLMIRSCGRTDFQQGSADQLFESVREKLFKLPEETLVYPGHDYRGMTSSTIGLEKKYNARLGESKSLDEFKKIMAELKLANPRKIHEAVPANLACGRPKDARVLHPQAVDGIPEITCEDLFSHLPDARSKKIRLIDVRRPDEFNNELGHIEGASLVTLGPDLTQFLQQGDRAEEIVFVCRSGGRSGTATAESIQLGYKFTINMTGGMIRWNEKKFPVKKESL